MDRLTRLVAVADQFTAWEASFAWEMTEQLSRGEGLSPQQSAKLVEIEQKYLVDK